MEKKVPKIFQARDHFYIFLDEELVKPLFLYGIINLGVHQEFRRDEQSTNRIVSHNEHYVITSFFNNTTEFIENLDFLDRNYFLAAYSKNDFSFVDELKVDGAIYGITRQGYLIEIIDDNPENFTIRFLDIQPVAGDS